MNKASALLLAAALAAPTTFAAGMRTATLDISKMDCAACPIAVRESLKKVPGVASAKVDFKTKRALVVFDSAQAVPETLTKATADAGFPSKVTQLQ